MEILRGRTCTEEVGIEERIKSKWMLGKQFGGCGQDQCDAG
jgi:hypothetical protein